MAATERALHVALANAEATHSGSRSDVDSKSSRSGSKRKADTKAKGSLGPDKASGENSFATSVSEHRCAHARCPALFMRDEGRDSLSLLIAGKRDDLYGPIGCMQSSSQPCSTWAYDVHQRKRSYVGTPIPAHLALLRRSSRCLHRPR